MRNFLRNSRAVLLQACLALAVLGLLLAPLAPAFAQAVPPGQRSFVPRVFPNQQTHYTRFTVNWNSCTPVALACSFKVGSLPYNSFIARVYTQTTVTFAGATTETLSLGTTATPTTEIMAATTVLTAGPGIAQAPVIGVTAVGNGIAQTGTNGGFDVWARLTATVANPTAGQVIVVVEWVAPNDGSCTAVPMGTTAGAC